MLTCKDCRYWDGDPDRDGVCRRRSPAVFDAEKDWAVWPVTSPSDWCGDLKGRPLATLRDLNLNATHREAPKC